jgi:hypothetical protein
MKNAILPNLAKVKRLSDNQVLVSMPFTLDRSLQRLRPFVYNLTPQEYTDQCTLIGNIRKTMESKGYRNVTVSLQRMMVTGVRNTY